MRAAGLASLTTLTLLLVSASVTARYYSNGRETAPSFGHRGNCSSVFEQGSAWVQWRENSAFIQPLAAAPYCVIQKFDNDLTQKCLERRLLSRRQPFQAFFIGDSRARELFAYASPRLGADHEFRRGNDNCLERFNRTYEPNESRHGRDHWCSYGRHGRLINATYLLRHYLDRHYLASVQRLVDDCESGACPGLLLANGGLHEMWRQYGASSARGVQRFGRQLEQLAPLLASLARRGVTVIWALSEPMMEDAGGGFVRMTPEVVWLLNQAAADVLRRFPSVHVWSSHIAVALWYHDLCRALDFPQDRGFNCGDHLHVGAVALVNYQDILLNYLCDGLVEMPDSSCCGMTSQT